MLRTAWRLNPGDFWVNHELGEVYQIENHYIRPEDAIRFGSAAVAIRPRSFAAHLTLGVALKDARKLEEADNEFRSALALRPGFAFGHNNLGNILAEQGKFEESLEEFRAASRIDPGYASPHDGLGNALRGLGRIAEAIAEHRAALRLKPDSPLFHANLASGLRSHGELDEAIVESRAALRLMPNMIEAQYNLGLTLRARGDLTEAVAELRRALDLARKHPAIAQDIERVLVATERQASAAARLPAILAGKAAPVDAREMLGFAQVCYDKGLHASSARFWADAFLAEPKLADDRESHLRYNAACSAALAGCGHGKDEPPPDDACRIRWRRQALEWLDADLKAWTKAMESGSPRARQPILKMLQHWKADPDLTGLRDPGAISTITEEEQKACHALWARVDALLARTRQGGSP